MNKPIRVLQIIGDVVGGGVETVIMNYYRNIDKSKVQFDFVMHKGALASYIKEVEKYGGRVYEITSYKTNIFKYTYEIFKIIKTQGYQVVHSNMNSLSGFSLFAAYLGGARVRILHNHTTDSPSEGIRTIAKRLLRPFAKTFANQYWACSKLAAEWMYGKKLMAKGKITIINNAIDLEKFKFNEDKRRIIRKQLNLENCFVIGHVGRFVKTKNHKFLIEIFNEILKQKQDAKLLLVGDGPLRADIERKAYSLGIKDKIIFTGIRNDVADLYNAMDVFVFPSLYEGLGMVAVEAQVNDLPIVVSENIPKEVEVTDNVEFISLRGDKNTWNKKIINAKRKKKNIKNIMLTKFNIKEECKRIECIYLKFYFYNFYELRKD